MLRVVLRVPSRFRLDIDMGLADSRPVVPVQLFPSSSRLSSCPVLVSPVVRPVPSRRPVVRSSGRLVLRLAGCPVSGARESCSGVLACCPKEKMMSVTCECFPTGRSRKSYLLWSTLPTLSLNLEFFFELAAAGTAPSLSLTRIL